MATSISSSSLAENIKFSNFSKSVILEKTDLGYLVQGTGLTVQLSSKLIIKTSIDVSKQQVSLFNEQIKNVVDVFSGVKSNYYVIDIIDQSKLKKVLLELQQHKRVINVQPDILQSVNKSVIESKEVVNAAYLSKLNIPLLWKRALGEGVKVAIIDDGFNLEHPDFEDLNNVFSYDVSKRQLSSKPILTIDRHGTMVAGIIFSAHNDIGINGIAPKSELIAIRQPSTWTSNTLLSFQLAKLSDASIINCSWHSRLLLESISDIVDELAHFGRQGKGIAVIISAGNQGKKILTNDTESSIQSAIVVGAVNHKGLKTAFSNYGRSVDLWVFGGKTKTTLKSGLYGSFSGTSLSASIVSGLAALLLSAQPELTLTQLVREIELITNKG